MNPTDIAKWLEDATGLSPDLQGKLLASILGVVVVLFLRKGLMKIVYRFSKDATTNYRWRTISGYIVFVLALFLVGRVWLEGFHSIATYLGLLSAGLAIALKELVGDVAGWAFINLRRPFSIGDRIQIGDFSGDVIDIRLFQFSINEVGNWVDADQSTGRIIHVPNRLVFTEIQANYTEGFGYVWNEIPVLVTFESKWRKSKTILQGIADDIAAKYGEGAEQEIRKAGQKYLIYYSKFTPKVYTSTKDSGVLLTIRYLCKPRMRRNSEEEIWEAILDVFDQREDMDFAYITRRGFSNVVEGKKEARATPLESTINTIGVNMVSDEE